LANQQIVTLWSTLFPTEKIETTGPHVAKNSVLQPKKVWHQVTKMMFCLSETAKKMARQNKNWLIRHDPPAQPAMTKSLVAEHLQFTTERQKHKIVMTMSRGARN